MRPGQDWKLLILASEYLQDLAGQRKTWLAAALTALGSSSALPPGTVLYKVMLLKGHGYVCAVMCIGFTAMPLLVL